eukprot:11637_3
MLVAPHRPRQSPLTHSRTISVPHTAVHTRYVCSATSRVGDTRIATGCIIVIGGVIIVIGVS